MILERDRGALGDGYGGVLEDDGPFGGVIGALAGIGGVIGIPNAGGSEGEVDDGVFGDVEDAVGAIGTGDDDVGAGVEGEGGEGREGREGVREDMAVGFHG